MSETFTFALIPGKYDAPVGPLRKWLEKHNPTCAGHTEVNNPEHAQEIAGPPDHRRGLQWDHRGPGHTQGNAAVSWDMSDGRVPVLYRSSFKCTDLTYNRVGGAEVEIWAQIAVLAYPEGNLLISSIHMPSSVEDKEGFKQGSQRVRVLKAAARGWRRECRRLSRKYNAERVISGDFNINARRQFARRWFSKTFKRLRPSEYARKKPNLQPTHGNRAIDRILHSKGLKAVTQSVYPAIHGGYDHRPQVVEFRWNNTTRWHQKFGRIGLKSTR